MKVLIQICLFLQTLISTTNSEVMFKLITDKQIHTLKYFDNKGKKIGSLLNSKDTSEKNASVSDKILWNLNLPKPFYLNVFYPMNKDYKFNIEFNDLKNDVLYHVHVENKNTKIKHIKFIKGSIRTKEKVNMKSSFDPLIQSTNNVTVSDTAVNLELLNTSLKYCSLVEQIVHQSKFLKENLQEILFEIKDFEKAYNDLSMTYGVEKVGNIYSCTIYKLINHIFCNLSRLYFIESIKDDLLKFEELKKLLEKIHSEIFEKITLINEKISNNKDMVVIKDLEQKSIAGFKNKIRNFTKFESLYSAIESIENIIKSSEKVKSSIQETKIIKSIELNNMENFYKFYSPLIKNSFELISKKHMENSIVKFFEDEYYDMMYNDLDQLESDSYDFVFIKFMNLALNSYENNPRHLKFIFFFEYFLSMKVSTLIESLEKEKTFYEKLLLRLENNADEKFNVYIKSILDNIETCINAWKDINKVKSFLKTIKNKTLLDLIKESKDNLKLPYDDKLNYKTPIFSNSNQYTKEINEKTFYGPTKDEIFESLKYEKNVNSANVANKLNLKTNKSVELVLSYAKEVVLPLGEINESLPIKSSKNYHKRQTEQNTSNELGNAIITNLEPHNNVDKQQEQIVEQNSQIEHSPLHPHDNDESQFKDLVENYYKLMFRDKNLCDYQEEFSLKSLSVNNSLENFVQPESTHELYKNSPPSTSKDEEYLFYKDSPLSTSRDQCYFGSTSPTIKSTNLRSYRLMNIPAYNGEEDQYNSSDSLSSNASSLSNEHSDGGLDKLLHTNLINSHKERIITQSDSLRQNNMVRRRVNSEPSNSLRGRCGKHRNSKKISIRKRSISLPCFRNKEEFLKYYNLPDEKNYFFDSALGMILDTSYDSTPEDCLFDLYTDSDRTERNNAVNLLNTWIDIKNLDSDCGINFEDDNQTIKNDSNDNETWSETIDKENLETKEDNNLTEIEEPQAKQSDANIPHIQSEIKKFDNNDTNGQNLNVLKFEDDNNFKNQHAQNVSYGSETGAINESIVDIRNQPRNLAITNCSLNSNCSISTSASSEEPNNTEILEFNKVKDSSVSLTERGVLNDSKLVNVGDKNLKDSGSNVEILSQDDTTNLQLSNTIGESNLKNPRSVNERSLEISSQSQHGHEDSKGIGVSKQKSAYAGSTNNLNSEVINDVLSSNTLNQIDMSNLNPSSSKILEQVDNLLSSKGDNSHPKVSKDNSSTSNVSKQVDNSPFKVLKGDISHSKVSEQIDNSPLKASKQVDNSPSKVSKQVIGLSPKDGNLTPKSSDRIENSNLNSLVRASDKAPDENKIQANSINNIRNDNNDSLNPSAKEIRPDDKNANKPDEKYKNKPPVIRISFDFSRSGNNFQRSRRT